MSEQRDLLRTAVSLHQNGELEKAQRFYLDVLRIHPENPDALNLLGVLCSQMGNHEQAVAYLHEAIGYSDTSAFRNNLGGIYKRWGKYDLAKQHFEQALVDSPESVDAMTNLATLLGEMGADQAAYERFECYYTSCCKDPKFLFNFAHFCIQQEKFGTAKTLLLELTSIAPHDESALFSLGMVLKTQGDLEEAITVFSKITNDPARVQKAKWYVCQCQLLLKQFEVAWPNYSTRFFAMGVAPRRSDFEVWNGQIQNALKLVVWAEQGIGDELMFSSLIPLLCNTDIAVHYECDPRLLKILQRTHPDILFFARDQNTEIDLLPEQNIQQCFIGDLPKHLCPELRIQEAERKTFALEPSRKERLRASLAFFEENKFVVGLSHHTSGTNKALRTPDAAFWNALCEFEDQIVFVDLQFNAQTQLGIEQAALDSLRENGMLRTVESLDLYNDIDGVAHLLSLMDCVITIDNYIAHLAGRVGVDTKVLLPTVHDWRWFLKDPHCPWYSKVELLRQREQGSWQSVQERLIQILRNLGKNQSI